MIDVGLAMRYVQPLFEVACARNIQQDIFMDLEELNSSISVGSELRVVLTDPAISKRVRISVLEEIFSHFSDFTMNFVRLVIEKNRAFILEAAHPIFKDIKDESEGLLSGVIESALPLDSKKVSELKIQLEKSYGHKLRLEFRTDQEILGGLRIRVGNSVMDGSIKGKLENLKKAMIE